MDTAKAYIPYIQHELARLTPYLNAWVVVGALLMSYCVYGLLLALYRLTLHPLARFPGPRICAITEWYEFYCYIIKQGEWGNEVRKMHEKYGKLYAWLFDA